MIQNVHAFLLEPSLWELGWNLAKRIRTSKNMSSLKVWKVENESARH